MLNHKYQKMFKTKNNSFNVNNQLVKFHADIYKLHFLSYSLFWGFSIYL